MRYAALGVVLLLLPSVAASEHEGTFLGASYTLATPVDPSTADVSYQPVGGSTNVAAACGDDHVLPLSDGTGFRFSESEDENGCAEVRFMVDVPAGAGARSLAFRADRTVGGPGSAGEPVSLVQSLHLYDDVDAAEPAKVSTVFPTDEGTRTPRAAFEFPLETAPPAGGETLFAFYFEDRNALDTANPLSPSLGHAFSATVTDIRVVSAGIALAHTSESGRRAETGDAVEEVRYVHLDVPPDALEAGAVSLHLTSSGAMELRGVTGPDGRDVPAYWIDVADGQGVVEAVVRAEALAAHGAGTYSATYLVTSAYTPVGAMIPIAAAVFLLPAVAGVVADRAAGGLIRVRRGPREGGRQSTIARWFLIPLGVLYAAIFLWVATIGGWGLVTTLPLGTAGILVYGGLLLCLVGFLLIGYLIKRDVTRHLQRDRRERQVLNEALQAAVTELERSNMELENFAYAASHDLQEPLRKIVNYNQLVDLRYRDRLDEEGREFLAITVDAGKRMQAFINDLLAYSRIAADEREPETVHLPNLMDEILIDLEDRIAEEGAVVEHEDLPTLRARPGQLRRLLQNLVTNAIKYRAPGRTPHVAITAEDEGEAWRITVADNGPGVPDEDLDRIFEPFRRGRSATGQGSGLGLAMCKRVVERNGGDIGVRSTEDGSRFWFTWPKVEAERDRALPARAEARTRPRATPSPA